MICRFFAIVAFAAGLFGLAVPANAEWYEAQSDHFVIYADDSERDIRRFAENLERYHSALAFLTRRQLEKPSPSNRVVIFVVGNQRDLRRVLDTDNRQIGGVYIPRAGSSRAYVQDIRNRSGYPHFSTVILLHEYAHHFLISSTRFAMPRWLSEGAAEFFSAASFNEDGSVIIGRAAQHRGPELAYGNPVSVEQLLDPEVYDSRRARRGDSFYGWSWLLYHYLTFNEERSGQLVQYQQNLMEGMRPRAAADAAFGDLGQLERELKAYFRGRFMTFVIPPERLTTGQISLRPLSAGEAEMMTVRMRSQRGVNSEQAAQLVIEAREIASRHPDDPGVQTALAEAEYDAGNDAAAIAAADAALARDPARTNAYVQKGYALFRMAADAPVPDAAYEAAMKPLTALNQRENDHPIPLMYYYRSFAERGVTPPENARAALERAAQLAPFDQGLWLQVAVMQAGEGKISLARQSLQPLAADPHGGGLSEMAAMLVNVLDQSSEGEPLRLALPERELSDDAGTEAVADAGSDESDRDAGSSGSEDAEAQPD
ncbi:hypothetical protein [Qipengyuania sp. ASV99]|uniref:hypothetical protein n=1 Tax=Qipengyuania sp. ASV99 TaxID=3399681 RepID=UPI003A4C7979